MKLFTSDQIRLWEQVTIKSYYEDSSELMELAAERIVEQLFLVEDPSRVWVVCGTGNNGGDGLCVARILASRDIEVHVIIVGNSQHGSHDFRKNLERFMELDLPLSFYSQENPIIEIEPGSIILDCLLGAGASRPAEGEMAAVIEKINAITSSKILSVDLPSGLLPDDFQGQTGSIVRASRTLALEIPKRALLVAENAQYVGELAIVSLGLDHDFERSTDCEFFAYDMLEAVVDFKRRDLYAHKKSNGHVRVMAGSKGKMGACFLASKAAMRAGAGLVTARIPGCGYTMMQTALPEAMCDVDDGMDYLTASGDMAGCDSLAIGPGMGKVPEVALMLRKLLKEMPGPCVLDADALNMIAEKNLLGDVPPGSILTPHIGEFHRLFGISASDKDRIEVLRTKSKEHNLIIILKGPFSRVATPDGKISFNTTGNAVLATAGSGDVLTGAIAGLLAQGYKPHTAARLGVFLHGLAGDVLRIQMGDAGALAGEIADALPHAARVVTAASEDPQYNAPGR